MPRSSLGPVLVLLVLVAQPMLVWAPEAFASSGPRIVPAAAVVLFDEAHFPVYTVNPGNPSGYANGNGPQGAYAAFARVLSNAGFTVRTLDYGSSLDTGALSGVKVLVIVCSQGKDPYSYYSPAPYTGGEINAVVDFVRNGGGLFLIGDHTEFPPAIFPIAGQFGIAFGQKMLSDPNDYVENYSSGQPPEGHVFIVFGRDNFNDHPIMGNITRVELYRTDIFSGLPPEAQPLIISDEDTSTIDQNGSMAPAPRSIVSAAIPSNGTAGAGRIVVVADTNTFETDENRDSEDTDMDLFDSDNARYGAQIVEWLADLLGHLDVGLGSAEKDSMGQPSITHNCTAGGDTKFYVEVKNTGYAADSYDLSAAETGSAGWGSTLSVQSVKLNAADARIFTLTVQVPPGARAGASVRFQLEARSRSDPFLAAFMNCTVNVPALHNITLTCADNRKGVHNGQVAIYDLLLSNRGNVRENVELAAPGPPGWECSLDIASLELEAASNRTLRLSVAPPPGVLGGTEAKVVATATSDQAPGERASADTYTRVIQSFSIMLLCSEPVQGVDPGSLVSFPVLVKNTGNGDDEVSLSLAGASPWGAYLEPSGLILPYNSTLQAAVVARAPDQSPAGESLELEVLGMSVLEPSARANISLSAVVNRLGKFRIQIEPFKRSADPGGLADFNVTVTNIGNAPETVMLSAGEPARLSGKEATVLPGVPAILTLSFPVPAGDMAHAQHFLEVTGISSINSSIWASAGAVVVVNQLHLVRAELSPDRLSIPPGEEGNSTLVVHNGGNGPEVVAARLERTPAGWMSEIKDAVMNIVAGGRLERHLIVGLLARTPAGSYDLSLNLSYSTGQWQLLPLMVEVPRVFDFTSSIRPATRSVVAGKHALFTLVLDNLGNSPELVRLSPAGARASWITMALNSTVVNYSGESQIEMRVRPGPEAMPGKYRLSILASGEGNETREVYFNLTVRETETSGSDMPCILGALMIAAASAAAYLARRKLRQAP